MWLDTTKLPDICQRAEPHELIGQVIGTSGTVPYVHLHLEMSRRLFGDTMPTLVANDGQDEEAEKLQELCNQYGVDFVSWEACGHAPGDARVFHESMKWAARNGLQIVAKFSRRSIPLIPWRHHLQYLAAYNTDAAFFTRRHLDTPHGLFRTDAIAYRLRCINNERVNSALEETYRDKVPVNLEAMFDAFQQVCGGWVLWDLLGPNFYKPWKHLMQWRGLLPYHYGDLSRSLGLPYTDIDFLPASFGKIKVYRELPDPPKEGRVIQIGGELPNDAPPAVA